MNATWQEVILNKCKIFLIFSIVLFSFGVVSAGDCPINEEDEYYITFSGIEVCNQEDQGFIDSINDNRFLLEYVNSNLAYNGDNFEVIVEDMSGQLSVSLERDSETFFH